jgi:hypothetical protein
MHDHFRTTKLDEIFIILKGKEHKNDPVWVETNILIDHFNPEPQ